MTDTWRRATLAGTVAFLARAVLPWRALAAAALLAVALGAALSLAPARENAPELAATQSGEASHAGFSGLPVAAQSVVSRTLGAGRSSYRATATDVGYQLLNAARHLRARFDRSGVSVSSGVLRLGLGLRAIGYGSALRTLDAVSPSARANRILYTHPGVSEWYANGPLGLEQGFTVSDAPIPNRAGPLTLSMALSANAHVTLSAGAVSITLNHAGGPPLRYGDLAVTDASGRALHSWLAVQGPQLLLRVDAHGARYPLRVDPLIQQGSKLTGKEETPGGELGTSVALSADGNTVLVGGPTDEGAGAKPMIGAAWVFTRSGSSWTQQGPKLTGGGEVGEGQFGISVALSADGNTALIGAINDEKKAGEPVGAVWVFTRSGSTWSPQGPKLTGGAEETPNGRFGRSVALSADGNTALIGGYFDEGQVGAAWVFTRSGSTWSPQGSKLTGGGETGNAQFGFSVAMSSDGNTALVGGPLDNSERGAAWVFTRSGSTWTPQGSKLTAGDEAGGGELGTSVTLSSNGSTAVTGGPGDGTGGAAWVFTRSGSTWSQQGPKLTPSDEAGAGQFGASVAVSSDASTALIGGPFDEGTTKTATGAAWEFTRTGSTWSQLGSKLVGTGEAPEIEFGLSVALSADGDTAQIGDPLDHGKLGASFAFVDPPPSVTTDAATNIGLVSATLNGTVGVGPSSSVYFQYGVTTAYGSSTPAQPLGRSGAARAVAALLGILIGVPYHYRIVAENSAGVSVGADQTFTGNSPGGKAPPPLPPILTSVSQSHRRWRAGRHLATFSRKRAPLGTTFSFTINEQAGVSFTFTQKANGRRVHGRCVAQNRKNRRKRGCKRIVTRGVLSLAAHAGANKVAFQGVISHSKKLRRGTYTMLITAANAARQRSNTKSLTFTTVR